MSYSHDLIVIGGGAAGLTSAGVAAGLGARSLLIERHRLGGDCTWTGCVPSKALLSVAKSVDAARKSAAFGLSSQGEVDFRKVIAHVHRTRDEIYHDADRPEIFHSMGVETATGEASFADPHTVVVDGPEGGEYRAKRIIIAAGGRPVVPPIPGLEDTPFLTSETLFEIDELPRRLLVIGAGPIGIEMAQAFGRLGSAVTVVDMIERILGKDDPELAEMLRGTLESEGVDFRLGANIERVGASQGAIEVHIRREGVTTTHTVDALLVATGRLPNTENLGLASAGVAHTKTGIIVDDRCRTSQKHIFAAGDITGRYQLTHMSEHMAKVAVTNALLRFPMKIDADHVVWATYTDPELASVGATAATLSEQGTSFETYHFPYSKLDRAVADSAATGLIKVFARRWNGRILGATVLGASAGELISEYALAMRNGVSLRQLADTIHPYPSYGLGARRAADQWYVRKQSARAVKTIQAVFGYRGQVNEYEEGTVM